MSTIDLVLWILAFLGVVIIYGGNSVVRVVTKAEVSSTMQIVVKTVGIVLSAVAMILLHKLGRLI